MKKLHLLKTFAAGLLALSSVSYADSKPNILLILADDLGYNDLSVQGSKQIKTPYIDSIANNGVRFTEGYVSNSVCAPSRAGLISGRIGIGFEANLPHRRPVHGLDPKVTTMADVLKDSGYKTFAVGKWHLGYLPEHHPNSRGFDEFYGMIDGSRSYFAVENLNRYKSIQRNGVIEKEPEGSYLTDRFTQSAVDYLDGHLKENSEQPFFMYLSYTAPHGPLTAKPGYTKKYRKLNNKKRREYLGMIDSLDEGVGEVLNTLKAHKQLDNTIVVFLSDNGGPKGNQHATNNGMYRGGKGSLYEGGVRVPFFIQWPKQIAARQVIDTPVISLDLMPLFAGAAGYEKPLTTSGMDILPLMTDKSFTPEDRPLFWRRGGKNQVSLRYANLKWKKNRRTNNAELYDLKRDPRERHNVAKDNPEIVELLEKSFEEWEAVVPDPAFKSDWENRK